jgi:hypothetical protein
VLQQRPMVGCWAKMEKERREKNFFLFDFIVLQKMVFTSILKSFSTLTKTSRHIKGYATA